MGATGQEFDVRENNGESTVFGVTFGSWRIFMIGEPAFQFGVAVGVMAAAATAMAISFLFRVWQSRCHVPTCNNAPDDQDDAKAQPNEPPAHHPTKPADTKKKGKKEFS